MLKTDLSKYNNDWYQPASKLKIIAWFICNQIFLNNYLPIPVLIKILVLKFFGAKIEKGVIIKPSVNIKYPWFLEVGENTWIGEGVWIDNLTYVKIGKNACLSQGCMLLTGNHDYKKVTFDLKVGQIIVEDGVWIGAKAVVCPNITCKTHSLLTVNSVATKDLEPYMIYQGNPAIAIRRREIST